MKSRRFYKQKHPKYKTEAERKAAIANSKNSYRNRNKEVLKEYMREYQKERYRRIQAEKGLAVKEYRKFVPDDEGSIAILQSKMNDLMQDHEELLQEFKKLENLVKWGKK
jgi:hypothetical protein